MLAARDAAQRELRANEQSLSITLNSIGDAVIATDREGRVVRMNGTAERLTGWALADAAGLPLTQVFHIVHALTREPATDPVQQVLEHGQVVGLANHTALLARTDIEMCRLLTLKAAYMMDTVGNKIAANEIAMIKVAAPRIACRIIDDAIQAHGGGGVTSDFGLARAYASIRTLRLADGPDEVHCRAIARNEFKKYRDNAYAAEVAAEKYTEVVGSR